MKVKVINKKTIEKDKKVSSKYEKEVKAFFHGMEMLNSCSLNSVHEKLCSSKFHYKKKYSYNLKHPFSPKAEKNQGKELKDAKYQGIKTEKELLKGSDFMNSLSITSQGTNEIKVGYSSQNLSTNLKRYFEKKKKLETSVRPKLSNKDGTFALSLKPNSINTERESKVKVTNSYFGSFYPTQKPKTSSALSFGFYSHRNPNNRELSLYSSITNPHKLNTIHTEDKEDHHFLKIDSLPYVAFEKESDMHKLKEYFKKIVTDLFERATKRKMNLKSIFSKMTMNYESKKHMEDALKRLYRRICYLNEKNADIPYDKVKEILLNHDKQTIEIKLKDKKEDENSKEDEIFNRPQRNLRVRRSLILGSISSFFNTLTDVQTPEQGNTKSIDDAIRDFMNSTRSKDTNESEKEMPSNRKSIIKRQKTKYQMLIESEGGGSNFIKINHSSPKKIIEYKKVNDNAFDFNEFLLSWKKKSKDNSKIEQSHRSSRMRSGSLNKDIQQYLTPNLNPDDISKVSSGTSNSRNIVSPLVKAGSHKSVQFDGNSKDKDEESDVILGPQDTYYKTMTDRFLTDSSSTNRQKNNDELSRELKEMIEQNERNKAIWFKSNNKSSLIKDKDDENEIKELPNQDRKHVLFQNNSISESPSKIKLRVKKSLINKVDSLNNMPGKLDGSKGEYVSNIAAAGFKRSRTKKMSVKVESKDKTESKITNTSGLKRKKTFIIRKDNYGDEIENEEGDLSRVSESIDDNKRFDSTNSIPKLFDSRKSIVKVENRKKTIKNPSTKVLKSTLASNLVSKKVFNKGDSNELIEKKAKLIMELRERLFLEDNNLNVLEELKDHLDSLNEEELELFKTHSYNPTSDFYSLLKNSMILKKTVIPDNSIKEKHLERTVLNKSLFKHLASSNLDSYETAKKVNSQTTNPTNHLSFSLNRLKTISRKHAGSPNYNNIKTIEPEEELSFIEEIEEITPMNENVNPIKKFEGFNDLEFEQQLSKRDLDYEKKLDALKKFNVYTYVQNLEKYYSNTEERESRTDFEREFSKRMNQYNEMKSNVYKLKRNIKLQKMSNIIIKDAFTEGTIDKV